MITFTHCAFMAKQACATFSQVVQKITPPSANNFLKFFFALFAILTLNAATAWAETKTEGFEEATTSTNYQGTVTVNTEQSDCGIGWTIYYGCVSTSSKISGNNSAALRLYTSNNYGYLKTTTPIDGLSKVTFNAKAATSNSAKIKVNISYSKDGSTWTNIKSDETYSTTSQSKSYDIPSGGKYFQIAISSNSTKPTKSNAQLTIDDVVFTYTATSTPVDPIASLNGASYTVGQTLDLSTLWTSNSDGAVTYSIVEAGTTGASINGKSFTATAAGTCTVKASQASTSAYNAITKTATITVTAPTPANPYKVTLEAGPGTCAESVTEASAGAGVTLPTPTLDCGNWEFAGWTTSSVATETTSKPEILLTGEYNPTANITLYAVYQRAEEGEGGESITTVVDNLTHSINGQKSSNTSYVEFSDKTYTSEAKYAGSTSNGNNNNITGVIQIRSSSSNTGIVTTASGGKVKKVIVVWDSGTTSGRTLDVYGKNSPYDAVGNLYASDAATKGTKLGSIVCGTSTELVITEDYEYIGLRSASNAMYLTSIAITWESTTEGSTSSTTYYHSTPECAAPCADPGLMYATTSIAKTVGDAAFTNPLTNTKNISVTYTSTNTDVATVAGNGQVTIKAAGTTTIKATWEGDATHCEDEASYELKVNPKTYTITIADNIQNGTVTASPTSAEAGTQITLTANPNSGYKLGSWTVEDASNADVTVTDDKFTMPASNVTVSATFVELPKYTVSFSTGTDNPTQADISETVGGAGITLPAGPTPVCPDWTFAGWAETSVDKTTTAPTLLKANDKYQPTSSITLYAVYSQTETTLGEGEKLSQTLKYDSWSYTGSTTDKSSYSYRMFHKDSYVESATFDLSTLTKVVVYGGTFGGDKYNSLTIGDGANVWKTVAVTGSSQTGQNTFTDGEALSGIGKLRITSNSGTAPTNGVRISKIEIYTVSSITTTTYNSNPNCTPPAEYTITWWANGEKYHTQTAVEGTAIEVPTTSPNATEYACDDKVFVGWVESEIDEATDEAPTYTTDFGKITGDKDFFAVFATVETISEGVTASLTKMTDADDFAVGDKVVIIAEGTRWGLYQRTSITDYVDYWTVSSSDGVPTLEEIDADAKRYFDVTTGTSDGTWKLGDAETGYLYNSESTNLQISKANSSDWTLIGFTDGTFTLKAGQYLSCRTDLESDRQNKWRGAGKNCDCESGDGCTGNIYYNIYKYVKGSSATTTYSGYVTTCEATTEALSGKFSTGTYEYAEFATGNLQYKPSTDTWRFAKQQYQYVGKDNIYVGKEDYKGWIDLFGWSADDKFGVNPSNDNANYQGKFVDWGTLFPEEGWSTLSKNQWYYLLNQRTNAASLKQIAMVGETLGIMLFPDEWTLPDGCAPTQQTHHDEEDGEDYSCDFVSYNYTLAQWTELENAGAIFLPAAGRRTGGWGNETISPHMIGKAELDADGHYKHYADYYAYYWTSTKTSDKVNYLINCTLVDKVKDTYTVHAGHVDWAEEARYGQSVRLAKVTSTLVEIGGDDNSEVIEANAGQKVNVQVNRTFTANDGYYTICLPFNLNAEKIGKAYQVTSITEHVAEQGFNMVFNEVTELEAGQPYLILPNNLTNPIFENVTISYTDEGETVTASGAGINFEMVGVINGGGQTELGQYWVGDNGLFYNGDGTQTTDKLGLRVLFNITNTEGQRVNIRARVVLGENAATGLDNSQLPITDIQKVIENGHLIIIRNGEKYNIQGQKL